MLHYWPLFITMLHYWAVPILFQMCGQRLLKDPPGFQLQRPTNFWASSCLLIPIVINTIINIVNANLIITIIINNTWISILYALFIEDLNFSMTGIWTIFKKCQNYQTISRATKDLKVPWTNGIVELHRSSAFELVKRCNICSHIKSPPNQAPAPHVSPASPPNQLAPPDAKFVSLCQYHSSVVGQCAVVWIGMEVLNGGRTKLL